MGYTTEFDGQFDITPTLKPKHKLYLEKFAYIRHMKRDPVQTALLSDPVREAVGLPIGYFAEFYVGSAEDGNHGQGDFGKPHEDSIIDYNFGTPTPGLWCQWEPNKDGTALHWNGMEKFYHYIDWLNYLIERFLEPWGYKLNGTVRWWGEEHGDCGEIVVTDNQVDVNGTMYAEWKSGIERGY